jgi:hypothetical protein
MELESSSSFENTWVLARAASFLSSAAFTLNLHFIMLKGIFPKGHILKELAYLIK